MEVVQIPEIDHWFGDGDDFPEVWGGLRVIGMPGHTIGHCGFYSERKELLFAADLFSNFRGRAKLPPPWFNVDRSELVRSLQKANTLKLSGGVLLSHCCPGTAEQHRQDLNSLAAKYAE